MLNLVNLVTDNAYLVRAAMAYNVCVFLIFITLYALMDFNTHFVSEERITFSGKMYYGFMIHTGIGCNEITPKTNAARFVTAAHAVSSWMQLLIVFMARRRP